MASLAFVPNWVLNLADRDHRDLAHSDPSLLRRIRLLPDTDQQLLHLALSGAHSIRQLARARQVNPGALSRRLARLTQRLRHPVVAALADHPADLPSHYHRIGLAHFLLGRSTTALQRQFGLPRDDLRAILGYLQAWARLRNQPLHTTED